MGLLNYSTSISAQKTAGEIQAVLARHGAKAIMIEYGDDGAAEALSFKVKTPQGDCRFRLPVAPAPVLKVLQEQRMAGKLRHSITVNREQAVKVAWRIVKDWVEAQMALLETEMVSIEEIFLPYLITDSGQTLYHVMAGKGFLLGTGEGGKED